LLVHGEVHAITAARAPQMRDLGQERHCLAELWIRERHASGIGCIQSREVARKVDRDVPERRGFGIGDRDRNDILLAVARRQRHDLLMQAREVEGSRVRRRIAVRARTLGDADQEHDLVAHLRGRGTEDGLHLEAILDGRHIASREERPAADARRKSARHVPTRLRINGHILVSACADDDADAHVILMR